MNNGSFLSYVHSSNTKTYIMWVKVVLVAWVVVIYGFFHYVKDTATERYVSVV